MLVGLHMVLCPSVYRYMLIFIVGYLATCSHVSNLIYVSLLLPYMQLVVGLLSVKCYPGCKHTSSNGLRNLMCAATVFSPFLLTEASLPVSKLGVAVPVLHECVTTPLSQSSILRKIPIHTYMCLTCAHL